MRKVLYLASLLALFSLSSCTDFGTRVEINPKSEVYYKGDGVNEGDAKKLGAYLLQSGFFDSTSDKSVQLTKDSGAYVVRVVVKPEIYEKDPQLTADQFFVWQDQISENAFGGQKTRIILADEQFEDLKKVDEITKVKGQSAVVYLKGTSMTADQAKKLDALIHELNFFQGNMAAMLLEKKNDAGNLTIVYDKNMYEGQKDEVINFFKRVQWVVSEQLFANGKLNLQLSEKDFTPYATVGEFTAEEKNMLLQQSGQTEAPAGVPEEESEEINP